MKIDEGINVLSLFDGMSCFQIAFKELGITVNKYYSSEIDKHAIGQAQLNFPNTIQLGNVTEWREWDIDWSSIDIIGAGSPCQGFSFAGKQLAFDDPRSKLFFDFALILKHAKEQNPNIKFLLENVDMKREYLRIISEYAGIFPCNINSNLVSAQNRERWYWSNIKVGNRGLFDEIFTDIPSPKDRKIFIKDILEENVSDKYYVGVNHAGTLKRSHQKAGCLTGGGHSGGNHSDMDLICVAMRGRGKDNIQQIEKNISGKTNSITTAYKDCMLQYGEEVRRYTPTECARLQTIPDWYKWSCSDSQQFKMLGNGWTVDIIKHILSYWK